jgi:hypothetical protein
MTVPRPHDDAPWDAWHPTELGHRLGGIDKPWCIVGGWALDLWHGCQTREHEDLEFTVLRPDLAVFREALADIDFYTAGDGIVEPLPPDTAPPTEISQIWCLDHAEHCWRVDMMIEPGTPATWAYKRDPTIVRPRAELVRTSWEGLPYLGPAAVLLFKAKYRRAKDEADFARALPKLEPGESAWLKACLEVTHPGHDWARQL